MTLKATKVSTIAADNFRLAKGKYITSADGDYDYIAFDLPKKCFILKSFLHIKTALTAGSTGGVTVGIKEPATAINKVQLADNLKTLPETVGVKPLDDGVYLENGGVLTVSVTKGNSAADFVGRVFVLYSVIH